MKKCSKCGLNKSLTEFYKRKTGLRAGEYYEKCKDCYKKRGREYYHRNHKRQLGLALFRRKKYIEKRKEFLEEAKRKPCMDCGKIYSPWVMDFDHRDSKNKIESVSKLAINSTANFEKIKAEIEKCDLVCANCHRERTHNRLIKPAEVANVVKAPL